VVALSVRGRAGRFRAGTGRTLGRRVSRCSRSRGCGTRAAGRATAGAAARRRHTTTVVAPARATSSRTRVSPAAHALRVSRRLLPPEQPRLQLVRGNAERPAPVAEPHRRDHPVRDLPVHGRLRLAQQPRHLSNGQQLQPRSSLRHTHGYTSIPLSIETAADAPTLTTVSSRLVLDRYGRLVVEVTVPRTPGEVAGDRMLVLGNSFEADGLGVGFLGAPTARKPEPQERQQLRVEARPATVRQTWPDDYPDRARALHAQGLSCPKVVTSSASRTAPRNRGSGRRSASETRVPIQYRNARSEGCVNLPRQPPIPRSQAGSATSHHGATIPGEPRGGSSPLIRIARFGGIWEHSGNKRPQMKWYEDIALQLETAEIPPPLWLGFRYSLGEEFDVTLAQILSADEFDITVFLLADEQAFLVRCNLAGEITEVSFLGSLAGGDYTETVEDLQATGRFEHPRLANDGPLTIKFKPNPDEREPVSNAMARAVERERVLREFFRRAAATPPQQRS
jgi:hypothetical protein